MNDWSEDIVLIAETFETDEYGNQVKTGTERTIQATKRSIMMSEFYEAAQAGIRPEVSFIVHPYEYEGEQVVRYKNMNYSVIRLYEKNDEELEIYLQKKLGD